MASELEKFEMKRRKEKETAALGVGAGVTGGLAAHFGIKHELMDRAEHRDVKANRHFVDFTGKLEPGDVLFHRRSSKDSAPASYGGHDFRATEADVMKLAKGDPYYHASLYMGKNRIGEAHDFNTGIRANAPIEGKTPEAIMAYRPKVSAREKAKALAYATRAHGSDYLDIDQMMKHGMSHLLSPTEGPAATRSMCGEGQLCSQFAANAYPDVFKKQFASPAEMRHSKDLELIARYNPIGKVTAKEKLLTRGVYPLLRNLKWGLGAGAAAYAGMSLADYYKKHAKGAPHG